MAVFSALTVDVGGTFHAFWSMPRDEGAALFTRSIDVARGDWGKPMLSDPTTPSSCLLTAAIVRPSLPLPNPAIPVPAGEHEVTSSITMLARTLDYHYDARSHRIDVNLMLVNASKHRLSRALTVVGTNLHSDFGVPVALNAQGMLDGLPLWRASNVIPVDGLAPGAHSKPLHFAFRVNDFQAPMTLYSTMGTGVGMRIRVYERDAAWVGL
jgi:hypothetical protein